MAAKRKTSVKRTYEVINGRKFKYPCKCKAHVIDCVTPQMWDEVSRQLYKKKR